MGIMGTRLVRCRCLSRGLFTQPFVSTLFDVEFIDPPMEGAEEKSLKQLQHLLAANDIACFYL